MKKILLILSLLISTFINAQITFSEQNIIEYSEVQNPSSVYMTDIDGDGDIDLLSASSRDDKIAWYENTDGNGAFGTQQIITTDANGARSVFAIDIDGDGDMDVLSASSIDNKIAWYENTDGNGTFGAQQIITTDANGALSVFAIDIDGDGDMDVISASASQFDVKIAWYENTDGNGTFGTQQIITTNVDGVNSVFAADIDGDGDMDVLSASDHQIAWYENTDGNGAFGAQQTITNNLEYATFVFAADIDGDGDMDVLSASYTIDHYNDQIMDNKIAWYKNTDGNGTFSAQQIITHNAIIPLSVFASDIDGDGDMDVLSASYNDGKIAWYENTNGNGTFGTQQIITTNAGGARSVFANDIDGDGDMDVFSISKFEDKIAWYKNTNGNGTFSTQQIIIKSNAYGASSVFAIDIDGDGDMDTLSASAYDDKIAWYENTDGNGTFGTQQIITTNADGASSVFAIDIDGDGDMDVLSASDIDDKIAWYENTDGNGTFGTQQIITTYANGASYVFAIDIDGDGDMDVLSASSRDYKIAWYENTDGNGTFGTQQIITTNAIGANSVFASDIDGDGDMDVLSTSRAGNKNVWYENTDGNGTFGTRQIISNLSSNQSIASDIDGDGDMDVISATDYRIIWNENTDGNGTFGAQQIISNVDHTSSIFTADIDGDGDMDVLSAFFYSSEVSSHNTIAWYENTDGNGTFDTLQIITTNVNSPRSVFAIDIDGDGDIDVISASTYDSKIAWYENLSTLTVNKSTLLDFSVYPTPTENSLNIKSETEIIKIEIYTKLGQLILKNTKKNQIDISNLTQGLYFIKVEDLNGNFGVKKIMKK